MSRSMILFTLLLLLSGIYFFTPSSWYSHTQKVSDIVIPPPERVYPVTKALDTQKIKALMDTQLHKQPKPEPIHHDASQASDPNVPPPKIRQGLTFDHPEGEPPSDAELVLLGRGLGHIVSDSFKGALSAKLSDAQTMMKHNSQWKVNPNNPLQYRHEWDRSTMNWTLNDQQEVTSVSMEFESTNSAPSMLGYEYMIGAGESWGLVWKKDSNQPVAGVVELADQRKVYYYCELHGSSPPYEPALCDFQLNQIPQSVYEYYQQASAPPLEPFDQILTSPTAQPTLTP